MEMNYQRRQDRRAERRQRRADKKAGVDNRTEEQKIQDSTISEGQSLLNALKGGATGAMAGAELGALTKTGVGTAIGAGVGFIVGFTGGYVEESNQQADLFQQRIDQLKTDQAAATRGGGISTFDDFMGDKFYSGMA